MGGLPGGLVPGELPGGLPPPNPASPRILKSADSPVPYIKWLSTVAPSTSAGSASTDMKAWLYNLLS